MYVTCNVTDVRRNTKQLQHGGWGKGQASNPFATSAVVTQLLWFGIVTTLRSFLISGAQNSNKIPDYLKSTKLKLFFQLGGSSFRKGAPAYYVGQDGIRPQTEQQITGKKILENKRSLMQRQPLTPGEPRPTLNSSTKREGSACNSPCIQVMDFSLPLHIKIRVQIPRWKKDFLSQPRPQPCSVLDTISSKLRWLKISKHSTDLKLVSCYIGSII